MISPGDLRSARDILAGHGGAGARVALAIDDILNGTDPLAALGLRFGRGDRSPLLIDRDRRRDEVLRAWRARHFGKVADRAAAQAMATAWRGYRHSSPHDIGTAREFLFRLAQMRAPILGAERIRQVISGSCVGNQVGVPITHEARESPLHDETERPHEAFHAAYRE